MSVLKSTTTLPYWTFTQRAGMTNGNRDNAAFYTTDGMRFEFNSSDPNNNKAEGNKLHESNTWACAATNPYYAGGLSKCGGCGSYGLTNNPNGTTKPPCIIMVDVNGDRKPTPNNVNCQNSTCGASDNVYKVPLPAEKKVRDIFSILITEDRAIPYGVTAQKAMYQAQK